MGYRVRVHDELFPSVLLDSSLSVTRAEVKDISFLTMSVTSDDLHQARLWRYSSAVQISTFTYSLTYCMY